MTVAAPNEVWKILFFKEILDEGLSTVYSITKQAFSQPTENIGPQILSATPVSPSDAEMKYLMGIRENDPNGGTVYKTYISPYI